MSATYAWNRDTQASAEEVWSAIAAHFQGLSRATWQTGLDGRPLLVVQEAAALGQARELGFTIAADRRQPPCEIGWQVRETESGCTVTLTVVDPEEGWQAEAEASWLRVLDRVVAAQHELVPV